MQQIKQVKRKILLNPGPATTTDTVKLAQVIPDICPREKEFTEIMREVSSGLLQIAHTNPQDYAAVLFAGSGTLMMDVALNSLLPAEKKVLVINNGAYSSRAVEICHAYGLPHIDLRLPFDAPVDILEVKEALLAHTDVAVVYMTHHETGTGILNPLREIGALAHAHGAILISDTTSSYAMLPLDMEKDNVDICMSSAQKGIQAMAGLSFILGKKSVIEASKNYPVRSYYANLYLQYEGFQKTGEMRFTPPVQAVYAARQGIREYFAEGETAKQARHQRAAEAIHKGLAHLGLQEAIQREYQSGLVVAVCYPDDPHWNFTRVHDICYQHGFTIYPGKMQTTGTFRLCTLGAIDERDIEAFFIVFEGALREIGMIQ